MDPGLLLIIVFIVAPLIERLLKAAKGAGEQPEEPTRQRPAQRPRQAPPQRSQDTNAGTEDDAAAAMLPDDLWEILTGERRQPTLPVPQRQPEDGEDTRAPDAYADEAESLEEEWVSRGEESRESAEQAAVLVPHDVYARPLPQHEAPRVVSMEQLEFDDRERHQDFHQRLDALPAPARVRRPAGSQYLFTSDDDLRRAIVLSEILGTPKGLE